MSYRAAPMSGFHTRPAVQLAPFDAPAGLRGSHRQTLLANRIRKPVVQQRATAFRRAAVRQILTTTQGARIEVWLNQQERPAPLAILIHGWLGCADSTYVLSAAQALWEAGVATARLNLLDHGQTTALNEPLFHSARIEEPAQACAQLAARVGGDAGLIGFSLGGNFALRIAQRLPLWTLAVCPVVDPELTAHQMDCAPLYRWGAVRQWRAALRAKERAFPERYDFRDLYGLRQLGAITDLLLKRYTEFSDTASYYDAYRLQADALRGLPAQVIAAHDDPVIPVRSVLSLEAAVELSITQCGGHLGFVDSWAMTSWLDREIAQRFGKRFRGGTENRPS